MVADEKMSDKICRTKIGPYTRRGLFGWLTYFYRLEKANKRKGAYRCSRALSVPMSVKLSAKRKQ